MCSHNSTVREIGHALWPAKASRLLLAHALFAVAGPPIGGLVAWLAMGARNLSSLLPFLTGAYAEAALLAFGVGVLVNGALLAGYHSAGVPLAVALLANLLMFAATGSLNILDFDANVLLRVAHVFIPPSVVATFICWAVARRLLLR